ncbi:MAG TPA: hypothetical protein VJ959_14495 [Desulfotignum sp.]|nr:hypothetical protein [Desulfotignum sp.]
MLIDWFTVAAQVINFLILLVLLKIFLFDKIKNAMDQREKNIQERFDRAEKQKQDAEQEYENYTQKSKALEDQWDARLEEAEKEADDRRNALVKEARQEVDGLKKSWQNALEKQKSAFFERFQKQAAHQIFDTVKKNLSLLADTDVQDQAVKKFLSRFQDLDKDKLPESLEEPPRISTGFELSEKQKKSIQKTLSEKRSDLKEIAFDVRPELIFGLALAAGGKKITWHAQNYLEALEKELDQAIESRDHESENQ